MLSGQGQTNKTRAVASAAAAAAAAAAVAASESHGAGSGVRTVAALEVQWDRRLRRKGAGRSATERTLLELVTERRERAARAQERHQVWGLGFSVGNTVPKKTLIP